MPKIVVASYGEGRWGGASTLPSSLSSAASPPVASPVVPAGKSVNTSAGIGLEPASTGMAILGKGRRYYWCSDAVYFLFIDVYR